MPQVVYGGATARLVHNLPLGLLLGGLGLLWGLQGADAAWRRCRQLVPAVASTLLQWLLALLLPAAANALRVGLLGALLPLP